MAYAAYAGFIWLFFLLDPDNTISPHAGVANFYNDSIEDVALGYLCLVSAWFFLGLYKTMVQASTFFSGDRLQELRSTPLSNLEIAAAAHWSLFRGMIARVVVAALLAWPVMYFFRWFTGPVMVACYQDDPSVGARKWFLFDLLFLHSIPRLLYDEFWIWGGNAVVNIFGPLTMLAILLTCAFAVALLIHVGLVSSVRQTPLLANLSAIGWTGLSGLVLWSMRIPAKSYFYQVASLNYYTNLRPWLLAGIGLSVLLFVMLVLIFRRWLAGYFATLLPWAAGASILAFGLFAWAVNNLLPNSNEVDLPGIGFVHLALPLSIFAPVNPMALPLFWCWDNGDCFDYNAWLAGWYQLPLLLMFQLSALAVFSAVSVQAVGRWRTEP